MRILIIEDNRDIAGNIADYLEPLGHELDFAADGITGLHLAVTRAFDVIVLDLSLPGIDGITLCRKLRHEARTATPVLMLTARDQLDDKLAGFSVGAEDYLVKPFSVKELEARLQALVDTVPQPQISVRGGGTVALHIVPNAGHWLHVDNPAFLLELMGQNLY